MNQAEPANLPQASKADPGDCQCSRRWMWLLAALTLIAIVVGFTLANLNVRRPPAASLGAAVQSVERERSESNDQVALHPLAPALEFARRVDNNLRKNVRDYTATVLKQERILGKLGPVEICDVKIREKPFSAYMKFVAPEDLKGQEALFVEGANDGKMFAHAGSGLRALAGTVQIPPNGPIAMLGQRYPITELGIANLTRRLIEVGERDQKYGECYVWIDREAKVGERPATSVTVMHPYRRKAFIFHIARIFVDNELMVPVHYEAYDWPDIPGDPPVLLERYTYTNLKLNPGLSDADFDPKSPQYNFGLK